MKLDLNERVNGLVAVVDSSVLPLPLNDAHSLAQWEPYLVLFVLVQKVQHKFCDIFVHSGTKTCEDGAQGDCGCDLVGGDGCGVLRSGGGWENGRVQQIPSPRRI